MQMPPEAVYVSTINLNQEFGKVTERLVSLPAPRNEFAIEVDGTVISSSTTDHSRISA